jgi:hypothetical protein
LTEQVAPDSSARLVAPLSGLAALLALVTFLSWALLAGVHVDDTYDVHQVSGVWLTLESDAERGVLYPQLYDGHAFGGTRYMPGQVLVYAGAIEATGSRILGAKLVVYVTALLLFSLVFVSVRLVGCPVPVALALVAVALASGVGLLAATAVGGDTLPVLLQLAALVVVCRKQGRWAAAGAGLICALAILTKLSALWAPAAIVIWLVVRDRRRALAFASSLVTTLGAGLAATEAFSHGRFSDNLLGLSGSSFLGIGSVFLDSPGKLLTLAQGHASSLVVLFPFVLASLLLAGLERRITLYHLSFVFALAILCVVLADPGAFYNHLLDLSVLSVILVGDLWGRTAGAESGFAVLRVVVLAALVWAIGVGYYTDLKPPAAEAARLFLGRGDREAYAKQAPAGTFRPTDRILSDDPYVPLSAGQRPVVLDAFMLLRIAEKHPAWRRALVNRIDRHEFDKVALLHPLDRSTWWRRTHFGLPIVEAIQRNYALWRRLTAWRDLWIYVPKGARE